MVNFRSPVVVLSHKGVTCCHIVFWKSRMETIRAPRAIRGSLFSRHSIHGAKAFDRMLLPADQDGGRRVFLHPRDFRIVPQSTQTRFHAVKLSRLRRPLAA